MNRAIRAALVSILVVTLGMFAGVARAQVTNGTGTNVQDGNNRTTTNQRGTGKSGDAVGGQVVGVVSSGRTSVDARNTSSNSDVTSGDVNGSNTLHSFTGQDFSETVGGDGGAGDVGPLAGADDVTNSFGSNLQDGNNTYTASQSANAVSGDGVGGQVIGVVTGAGGTASIVAANRSDNVDVTTGDATTDNSADAFTGQDAASCGTQNGGGQEGNLCIGGPILGNVADVTGASGTNIQDGNNRARSNQSSNATTGDGVAGQVIGAVSSGATSIDANNSSTDVSVDTGDADASNSGALFTGQDAVDCLRQNGGGAGGNICAGGPIFGADVTNATGTNVQDGSNNATANQSANATSGDGVAGEVIGAVTSAGGSTSIVAANTSRDSDVTTGDSSADNSSAAFTGQDALSCATQNGGGAGGNLCIGGPIFGADVLGLNDTVTNVQDGSNRTRSNQTANAATGDGVAGQVIGAVSAGATSIDANNTSDGVSVDTGDASASNSGDLFVGQDAFDCARQNGGGAGGNFCIGGPISGGINISDVTNATGTNVQDGDNNATANQTANASTGDGVAGEVIGAVTSAGGSASIVAANTSRDSDVTTGDSDASNSLAAFVGLDSGDCIRQNGGGAEGNLCVGGPISGGVVIPADVSGASATNVQDGSNRFTGSQSANASSGDGVAGQVIGAVSAGATSVDARNTTDNSSVETGDSTADNSATEFVGLDGFSCGTQNGGGAGGNICIGGPQLGASDLNNSVASNLQDGSNRRTFGQTANASSGDAVAGQVTGIVTSAGGSASVVVANTSTDIDSTSGESTFDNSDNGFVGLNFASAESGLL